ncbi:MAG: DUF4253 domain-containing protein [Gemmataceae bacterium]
MAQDPAILLERLSGQAPRRYSTFGFGRIRDNQCLSVVVPEDEAQALVSALRKQLPPEFVAFVGTTDWLGDERHDGKAEVVVGKGESQFDILRLARTDACNYDMDTEEVITKLQSWHRSCGIDIFHAETDTVEFTLDNLPADIRAFANEVYEFCPDIVEQGVGSVDELEQIIKGYQYVYLWWD